MDASKIVGVLKARGERVTTQDEADVRRLIDSTTEAEQAGILTTLRRGGNLRDAMAWLKDARQAGQDLDQQAYEMALSMYADSTLLAWQECLNIAPALTYRSEILGDHYESV